MLFQLKAADFTDYELNLDYQLKSFSTQLERQQTPFNENQVGYIGFAITGVAVNTFQVISEKMPYYLDKITNDGVISSLLVEVGAGVIAFIYWNGRLHNEVQEGSLEVTVLGGLWRVEFVRDGIIVFSDEVVG